ncbi:hypothetical protein PG996_012218 [Apiospora saccharicola]|uniref:Uncharacterized protein n=1 Tax=Apiospora saccharicola TaxID=335842 RepID=A0ABR1U1Y2_9PEZI
MDPIAKPPSPSSAPAKRVNSDTDHRASKKTRRVFDNSGPRAGAGTFYLYSVGAAPAWTSAIVWTNVAEAAASPRATLMYGRQTYPDVWMRRRHHAFLWNDRASPCSSPIVLGWQIFEPRVSTKMGPDPTRVMAEVTTASA